MRSGNANLDRIDDPNSAEARAQRILQAAERLMAHQAPTTPVSAEHQLREYMQEMSLTRYGHAGALLSQLYGKSK